MSQTLRIQLLGDFRLVYGDTPVTTINTSRLQSILAYLLIHRDAPQSRQHTAFVFWPDSTEAHARGSLRKLLHQLSSSLPGADSFLQIDSRSLGWRLDSPFELDVAAFEIAAGDLSNAEALKRAADLYRGDLLPSCYDDWIVAERERLRQAVSVALEQLIVMLEGQRDYPSAIYYAQILMRHDPVHEETYRHLMRLYSASGDRAGALRAYHACATVLKRELDVEPSPATRLVYDQVLNQPELSAPPAGLAAASPLVGRQVEWARLQTIWREAAAGQPVLALISGEAGVGKTRLAEELVDWARRQGIATARAGAYGAEGRLAYAPVAAWLRARCLPPLAQHWRTEISRVLPELLTNDPDLTRPGPVVEAWQRQHLFEALAHAILEGGQPLLLVLDDIQWCDRETLEWLHYLLRFDPGSRLMIVATMRPEEIGDDQGMPALIAALRKSEQLDEIALQPLDSNETAELARRVTGRELDPKLAARLYRETEGNSLFVVEFLRARILEQSERTADVVLPPTVQSVIRARLAQLSPSAREMASLAATIGREFNFDVLRRVMARDEESLVRSLDELWRRRIVREHGTEGYDFTHVSLREVVYADLSAATRRWFHSQIAIALESLHVGDLDAVSAEIAAHFEKGNQLERALPYQERAALAAQRLHANQDAIALYQHGLELTGQVPPSSEVSRMVIRLHEGLGDLLEHTTHYDQARENYRQGLEVPPPSLLETARLHRKVGNTYALQRRHEEALAEYRLAEKVIESGRSEPVSPWWQEWISLQFDRFGLSYSRADVEEMTRLSENIKPVVGQHGTSVQRAQMYRLFNQINLRRDRYVISDETLGNERAAFAAIQELGDANRASAESFRLGFVLMWRGLLDEAEEHLLKALAWDEQVGDVNEKTLSLTYLTILYRKRGRVEEARRFSLLALESATRANMVSYLATAKANLAWVAWKQSKFNEAKVEAQDAVNRWAPTYPFQWTALFPLMAIALKRRRTAEAVQYARKLFDAHQQRLPEPLTANLEQAIRAWELGQAETARDYLRRGIDSSREMGYL